MFRVRGRGFWNLFHIWEFRVKGFGISSPGWGVLCFVVLVEDGHLQPHSVSGLREGFGFRVENLVQSR